MKRKWYIPMLLLMIVAHIAVPAYANAPPSAETDGGVSSTAMAMVGLMVGSAMVITCVSEWLVSLFFISDHRNTPLIVVTNAVSQTLMWSLYFWMVDIWEISYVAVAVILEVLVYSAELLVYWKLMKEVSRWRCIAYTLTANTVSLLLGILLM